MKPKLPALYLIALITITVIGSCKKDSITPDSLSGTYVGANTTVVSEIKMFTSTGEVIKRDVINKFVARIENPFKPAGTQTNTVDNIEITFTGNGTATVVSKSNGNLDPITFSIANKTNKSFVLVPPQSNLYWQPLTDDIMFNIFYISNQIDQFSNCREDRNLQRKTCDYTRKLPFEIIHNKTYALSYSFYILHNTLQPNGGGSISTSYYKDVPGIFNNAATKLFSSNDTLLLQTKQWEIIKKN